MKEKEHLTDSKEVSMEEGREITIAGSKERNNGGKTTTFKENDTVEIPTIFPHKLLHPSSFCIPCFIGKIEIERGLYDLGASVSIGPLPVTPFSL